jgi:cytochrome c-type biogenesis protein CcmH/NrfG
MPVKSIVSALFLLSAISVASAGQASPNPKEQISQDEQKAQQYLREKRPDLAILELKKIVRLDPNNLEARANLGVLLYFRGEYQDALPQLRAAIDAQSDLWKIRSLLGLTEEKTSDLDGARKDLEASFPMLEEKKLKIEVGLDLIGLYTRNEDLDQAANLASQLRKAFPDDPEILYAAYRTYTDLSGESMLSLSLVAPDSAQMHQLLAHEEIREGNTNAAVAEFRKAIAINGNLPGVHFELAELLNTSQDPAVKKEAKQEYLAALASNPEDEKAVYQLGEIAAQQGNTQMAFAEYTKAIALQPADSDAKLGLAKALIEMNQPEKAQALLEQTVQLDPTNATAHYRLATFYRQQGRTEDAKQQLEIYQGLRKEKDKLRVVYKDLLIQPEEIRADTRDDK